MKNKEREINWRIISIWERALASLHQPNSLLAGKGMVGGKKSKHNACCSSILNCCAGNPLPQTAPWQGCPHPSLLPVTLLHTQQLYIQLRFEHSCIGCHPRLAVLNWPYAHIQIGMVTMHARAIGDCHAHAPSMQPLARTEPCRLDALHSSFLPITHRGLSLSLHSRGCGPGCSGGGVGQTFCCQPRPLATLTRCQPAPSSGPAAISIRCRS